MTNGDGAKRQAPNDGGAFETAVEKVFRAVGADVVRNVLILNKKVDLLASFAVPGGGLHRVLVECKDEAKARDQNRRVMEMKALLSVARETNQAESAEIITRVPWSDAAKGFARSSGVRILTYREKVASLLDLRDYLEGLIERFSQGSGVHSDDPPLARYYVEPVLRVSGAGGRRLLRFDRLLNHWLGTRPVPYQLALLGGYGTGKTSLCRKLAHDLAKHHLERADDSRIPIIIDLRRFAKSLTMQSTVTSFLDEECNVKNPRFRLFEMMNSEGMFLIILDGFDEMAVRVDSDTLDINIAEIEKLTASPNARLLITGRTEYFISGGEQDRLFKPLRSTRTGLDLSSVSYLGVDVALWDDKRIEAFIQRRAPLIRGSSDWRTYWTKIQSIPGLSDLARRPVLLSMIVRTLPELIESGAEINRPSLYDTYLRGEIRRQKVEKRRQMLLSDSVRLELMQELAMGFLMRGFGITFRDAKERIVARLNITEDEAEAFTRDFLTCSFLRRDANEYHFSHRSIMEYAAARGLKTELDTDAPRWFASHPIDPYALGFLAEMQPNLERPWRWATERTASDELRSNATRILLLAQVAEIARKIGPRLMQRVMLERTRLAKRVAAALLGSSIKLPIDDRDRAHREEYLRVPNLTVVVGAAVYDSVKSAEEIIRLATVGRSSYIKNVYTKEYAGLSLLVYAASSVGNHAAVDFIRSLAQLDVVSAVAMDSSFEALDHDAYDAGRDDASDRRWVGAAEGGVGRRIDTIGR